MKINMGGGGKLGEPRGYMNIDLRRLPLTDLAATAVRLPFPAGSVDEILASDVLEHIPRHDIAAAFLEWHRVLKPGGILKVKTPNLKALAQAYLSGEISVDEYSRKLYGNQEGGDPANFHRSGLDPSALEKLLIEAGFREVTHVTKLEGNDWGNMGARAIK